MKISYGLENLRSLQSTPEIELRPITILVGRNSAGKSTYLRSFSLLKQSLEVRSSAPVLWYGDYVDFGDFEAAVHNNEKTKEITFKFSLENFEARDTSDDYYYHDAEFFYRRSRKNHNYKRAKIRFSLGDQSRRTIRKRFRVELPDNRIVAEGKFGKDGRICSDFAINGYSISELMPGYAIRFRQSNIFDTPSFFVREKEDGQNFIRTINTTSAITRAVTDRLRNSVDKRITEINLVKEARKILSFPRLNGHAIDHLKEEAQYRSFEKLYEKWSTDLTSITLAEIDHLCALDHAISSIGSINSILDRFFRGTTYLGPARARSERYYRSQELEVAEISPDGQNLPMFLASLSRTEQERFSSWVENLFGFGVTVERKEGHVSIRLNQSGINVNVADTGYGVSQLLPVLAQIWWATQMRRTGAIGMRDVPRPITMEQPELHLHPAHQAKLAEVLARAIDTNTQPRRPKPLILVETHSESLINHLGELIEQGNINASDVQIIVFSNEPNASPISTEVCVATFDSEGILKNWPYGFFNY